MKTFDELFRELAVAPGDRVRVRVHHHDTVVHAAQVTYAHSFASVEIGDRVVVRRSDYRVRFLHPRGWSYFDTLRKKLHWNEGGS